MHAKLREPRLRVHKSLEGGDEQAMDPPVAGHLRVERRREHPALPDRDGMPCRLGEDRFP